MILLGKNSVVAVFLLAGLTMLAALPAAAADLSGYRAPVEEEELVELKPIASGWYLRADLGISYAPAPSMTTDSGNRNADPSSLHTKLSGVRSDQSFNASLGFGYNFGGGFRADVTLDYTPSIRHAGWKDETSRFVIPGWPEFVNVRRVFADTTRDAGAFLLNGYYDFNTQGKYRPYVGAGLGLGWIYLKNTNLDTSYWLGIPQPNDNWTFTWALMAGVAASISENLDVDIGYRYINFGDAHSGYIPVDADYEDESPTRTYTNLFVRAGNMDEHQIRIGLRYRFDE
ncbi:MAG: outer membrane beta-barrel protein [Methylobacteriaceae bacterium]|jgi:opacity protein-like surface antigen|nr:outer membrane beta-barrel protein [Methylobacteriaceae bacterium]